MLLTTGTFPFRKDQRSFTLRSPESLAALFTFFMIPDWLGFVPRSQGQTGPATPSRGLQTRLQRIWRCSGAASPEEIQEA